MGMVLTKTANGRDIQPPVYTIVGASVTLKSFRFVIFFKSFPKGGERLLSHNGKDSRARRNPHE